VGDWVPVFVGLGSNLNDPIQQVTVALQALADLPDSQLVSRSSLYRSAPMGPPNQPWFINAVAELATGLAPEPLLDELQKIEQQQGRVRALHWGPRSLDLDILLYGSEQIATQRLTIPHPGISQRNFVLLPLLEIAPDIDIPRLGSAKPLASRLPISDVEKIASSDSASSDRK
jgi:2-amino-4-hydroxy-6-hydroxymethyldihydropteridine diphosphokinase